MALALARALRSDGYVRNEAKSAVDAGSKGGRFKERREATQRLMGFAFRLDVIIVSTIFVFLLCPFAFAVSIF